jgi:hypothetical protein
MKILDTAATLDIQTWLRGLLSAGISGGASAITGGLIVGNIDSDHFNFSTGKFYALVFTLFVANAVVSIAKFLQSDPLPAMKQVMTKVETVKKSPATVVTTTVQETHQEPVEKD